MTIPTITDDLIAEIEAEFQNAYDKGLTAYVDPKDGLALTAHIRQLEKDAARYQGMRAVVMEEREGCTAKLYDEECDRLLSAWQATQ